MAMKPHSQWDSTAFPHSGKGTRSPMATFWICLAAIPIIVFSIAMWRAVFRERDGKGYEFVQAVSNARQIGLALFEFGNDYHKYPDESTIEAVRQATGSTLPMGTRSSNDFFRQLLAGNYTQSEKMFFSKIRGAKRPDDVVSGTGALAKGECGFSYIAGLSVVGNPGRPIAITPLIPGTDRFDPEPFDGKAIILRMDNSATAVTIDKAGHAKVDGMNILDPKNPIWGNDKPVIYYPEL